MGKRRANSKSLTMPPSPTHSVSSSSSSDFEFTISLSPRKSPAALCPADELFYKGQLLPLSLSPRLSMVRTLLTSSSASSSTTASRDSTDSHSSFTTESDSSRPSSAAEEDELRRLTPSTYPSQLTGQIKKNSKYFSFSRFFKKDPKHIAPSNNSNNNSVRRVSTTAKEVIRKYLKKVRPLYEKISQKQQQHQQKANSLQSALSLPLKTDRSPKDGEFSGKSTRKDSIFSHSFSGNLRYPLRRSYVSSCPSSMRSSPSRNTSRGGGMYSGGTTSSMEELQSAIQGAIAHCKNSLNKGIVVSNEI